MPGPCTRATTRSTTSSSRSPRRTRCTRWSAARPDLILFATTYASRDVAGRLPGEDRHRAHEQRDRRHERRPRADADRGRDALRRRRARRARRRSSSSSGRSRSSRSRSAAPPRSSPVDVDIPDSAAHGPSCRASRGVGVGPEARGGEGRHLRRSRAPGSRELRSAGSARRGARQRRRRREPRRRRRRLGARTAIRSDRPARRSSPTSTSRSASAGRCSTWSA